MNGSHSGSGTVKSVARKNSLARYKSEGRREKNRDRRVNRIHRGFKRKEASN